VITGRTLLESASARLAANLGAEGVLKGALREVLGNIAGRAPPKRERADAILVQIGLKSSSPCWIAIGDTGWGHRVKAIKRKEAKTC
jgi:hypothetical protein